MSTSTKTENTEARHRNVTILPKVIAAGMTGDGRKKVVLHLLPVPSENGFALENWPSAIMDFLGIDKAAKGNFEVEFFPSGRSAPSKKILFEAKNLMQADAAVSKARDKINGLWSKVFSTKDKKAYDKGWDAFHEALELSSGGNSLGGINSENVRSNRQGRQAGLLEILRARELLATLAGRELKDECSATECLGSNLGFAAANVQPAAGTPDKQQGQAALEAAQQAEFKQIQETLKNYDPDNSTDSPHPAELTYSELCKALDGPLASHAYVTWKRTAEVPGSAPSLTISSLQDDIDLFGSRFFNIQSSPALGRLFMVFVDAEEVAPVSAIENDKWELGTIFESDMQCTTNNICQRIRTLVELAGPAGNPSFWPAVLDHLDGAPRSQHHGVVNLGEGARYEIATLDVRNAAESAYGRQRRRKQATGLDIETVATATRLRPTYVTGGVSLVDDKREEATKRKVKDRKDQNSKAKTQNTNTILLDAEHLQQGYRIDLGVADKDGRTLWRSMMHRDITYQLAKQGFAEASKFFARLLGADLKITIHESVVSGFLHAAKAPYTTDSAEGLTGDIIATLDGTTHAIDCSGSKEQKALVEDMPFGRIMGLPNLGDRREMQIRFGYAYRIGARAVYQGGISPTTEEAIALYELDGDRHSFAFPSKISGNTEKTANYRRFLRHERVMPPSVLLPSGRAFAAMGDMGFEIARHAIIRSWNPGGAAKTGPSEKSRRARPETTERYFMPPHVSQAFAALHGVFDDVKTKELPNGSGNVSFNLSKAGFPAAAALTGKGLNGEIYLRRRFLSSDPKGTSEPVFATQGALWKPQSPPCNYFADPYAQLYVVSVRHAGTEEYLAGVPALALAQDANGAVLPLRLAIQKRSGRRRKGLSPTQRDVLSAPAIADFAEPALPLDQTDPSKPKYLQAAVRKQKVSGIVVWLDEGDDFEIDVWCIPREESLADFAVVETLGAMALQQPGATSLQNGFLQLAPDSIFTKADMAEGNGKSVASTLGMRAPSRLGLNNISKALHSALTRKPVSEISAVQSLRVTHAVNLPAIAPAFAASSAAKELKAIRLSKTRYDALRAAGPDTRYRDYFSPKNVAPKGKTLWLSDDRAHDMVLGGDVLVDLDTCSGFEIVAYTAAARSPLLDDAQRKRSAADRRSGCWPSMKVDGKTFHVPTASVYGLHVKQNGAVELPRTPVTLLRVTEMKSARQSGALAVEGGLEKIALENLYVADGVTRDKVLDGARIHLEHAFADWRARRMFLKVSSFSRFSGLMATATHEDGEGQILVSEPLHDSDSTVSGADQKEVWLPASVAPHAPKTRSPTPVFRWSKPKPGVNAENGLLTITIEREVLTRIHILREWFSSGEGERLGLVLWPPKLMERVGKEDRKSIITLPKPDGDPDGKPRDIVIGDFVDDDLGPGGVFVTRWGGDPIRGGGEQKGLFMPPTAFADWNASRNETGTLRPHKPKLVDFAYMPVGAAPEVDDETDSVGKDSEPPLLVSLLTYEPHFDIDAEEWYVDLQIEPALAPDPLVRFGLVRYQEHAPQHLQVSQAVVEWVQLLPKRTVEATYWQQDKVLNVDVKVFGLAYSANKVDRPFEGQSKADIESQRPTFTFTAYVESDDGLYRRELQPKNDPVRRDAQGNLEARAVLELPVPDEAPYRGGKIFVMTEETELRPKATLPDEPVHIGVALANPAAETAKRGIYKVWRALHLPYGAPCFLG
jgi:hypothetical protein